MKFDTKGLRRKDFKTDEEYLSAVYDKNPIIGAKEMSKEQFIGAAKSHQKALKLDGSARPTLKNAVDKIARATTFTPYRETATENLVKGLKTNYSGTIKKMTNMVRDDKGRFTGGFKKEELKWDAKLNAYVYMGRVKLDFKNSPERIDLSLI